MLLVLSSLTPLVQSGSSLASFIVRALPGALDAATESVERAGGRAGDVLSLINGFEAQVPASAVSSLQSAPGVHSITPNGPLRLLHAVNGFDASQDKGSMFRTAQEVLGAGEYWNDGWTGAGVDIALIDSGVAPVEGLTVQGKVIDGPDLSFESQAAHLRYLDTFGHGTHMAGIMAGRDSAVSSPVQKGDHDNFIGVAPDARIISVKVADATGATDVSQVIAAIDWVVQHRNADDLNIRVLNLSFGTDGDQDYRLDPLSYAAEVAWKNGIVVVAAGGNEGVSSTGLTNPAFNPYLLAVGAGDGNGTYGSSDDSVPTWSSRGDGIRNPDLVAPGVSLAGLRNPGSHIDLTYPGARVGDRFFRGSGSSQAAAIVSGAAALVIQQRPQMNPDQVKALLKSTASPIRGFAARGQGAGMLDLKVARDTATPSAATAAQSWNTGSGLGTLEGARGSLHVADCDASDESSTCDQDDELRGEQDIMGQAWDGRSWSEASWGGRSWSVGDWNGRSWSGDSWTTDSWTGRSWSGRSWSGLSWSGRSWSGRSWSDNNWDGRSWSGRSWSGRSWSGRSWSTFGWGRAIEVDVAVASISPTDSIQTVTETLGTG